MTFSAVIARHFRSTLKWSAILGLCSLIVFSSIRIVQTRQRSKAFIISQVRETAIAEINSGNTAALDGEVKRIVGLWSHTEEFPVRVDVAIDGKIWAHGGPLRTFSWPSITDIVSEKLSSGEKLELALQMDIRTPLARFAITLFIFGSFFILVFMALHHRIKKAVSDVTRPLEERVQKIKEISENLMDLKNVTLEIGPSGAQEVQAIDHSLRQLVDRILKLENDLGKIHFTQGQIQTAEQLAHTMRGTIGNFQLTLKSPTLTNQDRGEFDSILTRLKNISQDVLKEMTTDISQPDGKSKEDFSPINVSSVIRDLFISEEKESKKRNLKSDIQFAFPPDSDVVVNGPRSAFVRSIADLLTNSIKATRESGAITARLEILEETLHLEIQDDGCGIPTEILPTLMNKGVTYGKEKEKGTGLGLYHARTIFEHMGGKLEIFSEGKEKGTLVAIDLPIVKTEQNKIHDFVLFPGQTLVIVDDDPSIHDFFRKKLFLYSDDIKIVNLHTPESFKAWFFQNSASSRVQQFFFDIEFKGTEISGFDLIEQHKLGCESIVISGIAHSPNVIKEAARLRLPLIHKDNLNQLQFKLELNEERYDEQLIS